MRTQQQRKNYYVDKYGLPILFGSVAYLRFHFGGMVQISFRKMRFDMQRVARPRIC